MKRERQSRLHGIRSRKDKPGSLTGRHALLLSLSKGAALNNHFAGIGEHRRNAPAIRRHDARKGRQIDRQPVWSQKPVFRITQASAVKRLGAVKPTPDRGRRFHKPDRRRARRRDLAARLKHAADDLLTPPDRHGDEIGLHQLGPAILSHQIEGQGIPPHQRGQAVCETSARNRSGPPACPGRRARSSSARHSVRTSASDCSPAAF